jgi:hypothetical protein
LAIDFGWSNNSRTLAGFTKKRMNELINKTSNQLYTNALLKSVLIGLSVGFLVATVWPVPMAWLAVGIGGFLGGLVLHKIYKNNRPDAIRVLHQTIGQTEHSLTLLDKANPTLADQLQLERLTQQLADKKSPMLVFSQLSRYGLFVLLAGLVFVGSSLVQHKAFIGPIIEKNSAIFQTKPSPKTPPTLLRQQLQIHPPAYTKLPNSETNDLNAAAVVGTELTWTITFSTNQYIRVCLVNSRGQELPFAKNNTGFTHRDKLQNSGLYAIRAYWSGQKNRAGKDSTIYQSAFYRLEAQPDQPPVIEPDTKQAYTTHHLTDPKTLRISAKMTDDFRVHQAVVVLTVARGSGENVKFRELRLPLSPTDFKQAHLAKPIDLAALDFAPGDELYYYWAATDNRQPEPNFTKSDTFFVVYKDTTAQDESDLATMAVNIMPEYFRSQRQIVIDTEKLIAKRGKMSQKPFNSTSNEIGFDQKSLRLRYGQYLGEEFETNIGGGNPLPTDADGDVVVGFVAMQQYMHKHDSENAQEGVGVSPSGSSGAAPAHSDHAGHSHGDGGGASADKDPMAALMEQYVHNHDNGEMNTFYEQSTRSLLKMALEQMWQSELHLRLYEPEKALPFENQALIYLKAAQQRARSFVKKSGFDPPPIKEAETRLTGELTNVTERLSQERTYSQTRIATLAAMVLGYLNADNLTVSQRKTARQLGGLLSGETSGTGLPNWSILRPLQQIAAGQRLSATEKQALQTGLYRLTDHTQRTTTTATSSQPLERAFWQHFR